MILLATNIILQSKQANSSKYTFVTERLIEFVSNDELLVICPQVIYEFYVVATRPLSVNGLGVSVSDTFAEIDNLLQVYTLLNDNELIFFQWKKIIKEFEVHGKTAHDANIVAFMVAHKIPKLFTLNRGDFNRYSHLIQLV